MTAAAPSPAAPPRALQRRLAVLALAVALAAAALDWNLDAVSSWQGFTAATARMGDYLAGFAAPDLSAGMLRRGAELAAETLAIALLGVALGLLLAYPLALGSSRSVVLTDLAAAGRWYAPRRLFLEACRLLLDVLRGVPDFLWAIVLASVTGSNAITCVLAIAVSQAGILGKVLSEQWDTIDPDRYAALRSTGASRLQVFLYGIQPLAARATLSFVLMRTECAVRNASVIGVVGGNGGLGTALWDEYSDGNWARMATVLLSLLALTTVTDLGANLLRRQLRSDPNHPRAQLRLDRATSRRRRSVAGFAVAGVLAGSLALLWHPLGQAIGELQRLDAAFLGEFVRGLAVPDLGLDTLRAVAHHAIVPVSLAVLSTLAGGLGAALLAFPGSVAFQLEAGRFTGEHLPAPVLAWRWLQVVAARSAALVLRGIPEVAWVVLLAVFFRQGITPCVLAVALHSTGVLHRVFAETIDDLPYRALERSGGPRRAELFLYGALPRAWPSWRTYAAFQFEVNLRIGIALGVVGAGGLGDRFKGNLEFRQWAVASTFLWAMVLLTVLTDRVTRRLQRGPRRC